ncbi:hypothetical protein [Amorphus sp. MBR-141]
MKSREPNGKVQRDTAARREDIQGVVKAQRIIHHGATSSNAIDPRFESALGRLYLRHASSDRWMRRFEAGRLYAKQHRAYLRICGAPDVARSILGKVIVDGERVSHEPDSDQDVAAVKRFLGAAGALKDAGRDVYRVVTMLTISDCDLADRNMAMIEAGLDALSAHYGLDSIGKAA